MKVNKKFHNFFDEKIRESLFTFLLRKTFDDFFEEKKIRESLFTFLLRRIFDDFFDEKKYVKVHLHSCYAEHLTIFF